MAHVRLQKVLADAGVASRRKSEELIAAGRVSVDGRAVREMGVKVDPERQSICCDGQPVRPAPKAYYLLNKPAGAVCTTRDPQGRLRAVDLIPDAPEGVYTVGRLDAETEGLVIVTNDGGFAQRIAHPRHGVSKVYLAWAKGVMNVSIPRALMKGVEIDGALCRAKQASILRQEPDAALVRLVMGEGRKREIRRMLKKLNHPVVHLRRVAIGPVEDDSLAPGQWRELRPEEIEALMAVSQPAAPRRRRAKSARRTGKGNGPQGAPPPKRSPGGPPPGPRRRGHRG